jgi:hypothetical protein
MKKILGILIVILFSFPSCEKDDICDDDTTPRIVIDFYDYYDTSELLEVTDLKVVGEGMDEGIVFDEDETDDDQYLSNDSTISLPLDPNSDSTTYNFTINYGSSTTSSTYTDQITFYYTRENVYVSRACGYKTVYTLDATTPFVHTSVPSTSAEWMLYISVQTYDIIDEDETHVKIFF